MMHLPLLAASWFAALCLVAEDPVPCAPGWEGAVLIGCDSLVGWAVEKDTGSSGSLRLADGVAGGRSVELEWDLGTGDWVQARFDFSRPVDLSRADIFGISLQGGGPAERANTVGILIADVDDVFYGYDMAGKDRGINQVGRPLVNLPIPKDLLRFFFAFGASREIDWSRIRRFFVVVKRPGTGLGGGSGRLRIDRIRHDTAALWPRQARFETVPPRDDVAGLAIDFILAQQRATGLVVSWKEEAAPKAWLYDQALALIALSREGRWAAGAAGNEAARAADRLAGFLASRRKADGHWARGWNPVTGAEIVDDGWAGDQAWCVTGLADHFRRSGDADSRSAAAAGADWLAARIDPSGKLAASTEGNVDAWWALVSTCRFAEADRIRDYLLRDGSAWDPDLRFWRRGYEDPVAAMDAATWLSAFARHPLVGEPERGLAALSFVRKALVTASEDGSLCGFDGMGPVGIWNEGTAQYVAAGGEDADRFLETLIAQQRLDGSMPGSTGSWSTDAFGWLTEWSGIAPTAWLYFAVTGLPFPLRFSKARGDANGDGGLDIADPLAVLMHLFLGETLGNSCGEAAADADRSGAVDLGDVISLLTHLFLGGPEPDPSPLVCECGEG